MDNIRVLLLFLLPFLPQASNEIGGEGSGQAAFPLGAGGKGIKK